jgi:hypothetical protein
MDDLINAAETTIQKCADPAVVRRYFKMKNNILFGSLAPTIAAYQKENNRLTQRVQNLQAQRDKRLDDFVHSEIVEIFSKFGKEPSNEGSICIWAEKAFKQTEAELRIAIDRFRSNESKFRTKINRLKSAEIPGSSTEQNRECGRKTTKQEIEGIEKSTRERLREFDRLSHQNETLRADVSHLQETATARQSKLKLTGIKRRGLAAKLVDLRRMKKALTDSVEQLTESIQQTKLSQRFGNGATSVTKQPMVERVYSLRKEVADLEKRGSLVEKRKTQTLIGGIKSAQQRLLYERIGCYA